MKKLIFLISFLFNILALSITANAEVIDKSSELSQKEIEEINEKLDKYEQETNIPVTFYLFDSLGERDISSVAYGLYSYTYKKENGIIILYCSIDENIYIESGKEIEGVFTESLCDEMSRNAKVNFDNGDYSVGISSLINTSKMDEIVQVDEVNSEENTSSTLLDSFTVILGMVLIVALAAMFILLAFS